MREPEADERRRVRTVSELTRELKLQLEGQFTNVWVVGEISNLKQPSSGHSYFVLKDDRSQLPAVMFRGVRRFVRFRPEDGLAVLVRGRITVYEPRGAYQIQVEGMEPRGQGALRLAFDQLKARLEKEGLFAPERKRRIAAIPRRIGIVTSPTGAAVRDFYRVLSRRFPNVELIVYPAQVQGTMAAFEIVKGIHVLNRIQGLDAILLTRGGGSLEDLWPFNEESVARAVFTSAYPVVSAVGHEVDVTISDYVADLRAPTPSAAAEMLLPDKAELSHRLSGLRNRLDLSLNRATLARREKIRTLTSHYAFGAAKHAVELRAQRVDELSYRLSTGVSRIRDHCLRDLAGLESSLNQLRIDRRLEQTRRQLEASNARLDAAMAKTRRNAERALVESTAKLNALSPLGVLGRGYSLTWTEERKLLRSATDARKGDSIRVTLRRGELDCTVDAIHEGSIAEPDELESRKPTGPQE